MTIRLFDKHKLLVEGPEDKLVLSLLFDGHVIWGDSKAKWIADIIDYGGVDNLLAEGEIETQLKTPRLEALGIIVDANDDLDARWQSVRIRCAEAFPNLPKTIPKDGLIAVNADSLRLGVWIMPDNETCGMLETFLAYLLPDDEDPAWKLACETVEQAIASNMGVKKVHEDKARIHTWLAIQNPPGQRLEVAILEGILDPQSDNAQPLVDWFVELFQVKDKRRV